VPKRKRPLAFWIAIVALLLIAAAGAGAYWWMRGRPEAQEEAEAGERPKQLAPADLAKYRDQFAAGIAAIDAKNGADAVTNLSSFDFGSRAVEEYRLYYLAKAYDLTGDKVNARRTRAALWRRVPKLVHNGEVGRTLAEAYVEHGDFSHAAAIAAGIASRTAVPNDSGAGRWQTVQSRFADGDIAGALYAARNLGVKNPRAKEAADAIAVTRALTGVAADAPLLLNPSERLDRAVGLMRDGDAKSALEELTALEPSAPASLKMAVQLNRGLALHHLRRFEDSNKVLEPLTSGPYKYAIPALYFAAKNYRVVSASIDPTVYKTIVEKKKVGTVKVRVGKGKKRRTVTRPKYANVKKQIKLIDLAKKNKKDEYDRLGTERLKDLLSLQLSDPVRVEVLNALAQRAQAKNQEPYARALVPTIVELDPLADPALQFFWDKAWAAYVRGDLNGAKERFRFIADTYRNVNVRRQSDYWYARTVERLGSKEEAAAIYTKLAAAPYDDLYSLHAQSRGAKKTPPPAGVKRPDWSAVAEKEMPPELRLAYELTALSQLRDARLEVQKNETVDNKRYANALLADLYANSGSALLMYRTIRIAFPQLATVEQDQVPEYFVRLYYPMKYHDKIREESQEAGVDPQLVMALILQESYYNPRAKSRVGATGLMQIMPPTGKELAQRMGIPFGVNRLEDPNVNITLGTRHLRMLIDLFGGQTHFAVASYNAGQGNVAKWRRAAPRKPPDEFLESIPFPETRNYVKRVAMLKSSYERLAP
jgi:soluble lytic murein transglycosylase-like protein